MSAISRRVAAILLALITATAPIALSAQTAPGLSPAPWAATLSDRLLSLGHGPGVAQSCCKTCRKGKACGDSCISKTKSCHKGSGCACNG